MSKGQTLAEDNLRLIPTSYRDRISKELSFPIGAEVISRALQGVPEYKGLWLTFQNHYPETTPDRVRNLIQRDEPIRVLEYDGCDHIYAYPVLRENKALVRRLLVDEGLPRLRQWLVDYDKWINEVPDRFRRRRCKLSARTSDATLYFREKEFLLPEWEQRRRQRQD